MVAEEINIKPTDKILSSGIPFVFMRYHKYPEPAYILSQLPQDLEQLVIGGFHQWDCVDKVAQTAYEKGIPIIVDEDTTEIFFKGGSSKLSTPLIRENFTSELSGFFLEYAREVRLKKPWFAQL